MHLLSCALALAAALSLSRVAHGFYLPGVAPLDFEKVNPRSITYPVLFILSLFVTFLLAFQGVAVNIKVNKLSSTKTQLPYEYYAAPFCKPKVVINSAENLGEVLRGDRIENSVYSVCYSMHYLNFPC